MSLQNILKILNRNETFPNSQKVTLKEILTAFWAEAANTVNGVGLLRQDGSLPLTADWDVGAYDITAKRLISDVATGTPPLAVSSTTAVTNLKADTVVTNANLTGVVTSTGNATAIANGAITNAMLANAAVANLSGTNTGDQTNITGNAATVTTNANLTGPVTSIGNATSVTDASISVAKLANATDGELITWDSNGVATTVAVGTAGHILTSNGAGAAPTFQLGVDFSANAGTVATGATTESEELTHYEDGIWTPNLWDSSFSSAESQGYDYQYGEFTRIGNIVFFSGVISMNSLGTLTAADAAYIGPLPYTSHAGTYNRSAAQIGYGYGLAVVAGAFLSGAVDQNTNRVKLYNWDQTTGPTTLRIDEISADGILTFSGHYFV